MNPLPEPAWVWMHGSYVPARAATVSIFDRSFLYGDGLFETLRAYHGQPFQVEAHLDRLGAGADFLGIRPPSHGRRWPAPSWGCSGGMSSPRPSSVST